MEFQSSSMPCIIAKKLKNSSPSTLFVNVDGHFTYDYIYSDSIILLCKWFTRYETEYWHWKEVDAAVISPKVVWTPDPSSLWLSLCHCWTVCDHAYRGNPPGLRSMWCVELVSLHPLLKLSSGTTLGAWVGCTGTSNGIGREGVCSRITWPFLVTWRKSEGWSVWCHICVLSECIVLQCK